MTAALDYTQAVILSGGGAYGAYEVGVMKALLTGKCPSTNYEILNPGIFTGTSVGAINASVIVSHPDAAICSAISYLEDVWLNEIADGPEKCGNGVFRFRANPLRYVNPECFAGGSARPFGELADDGAFLAQDWFRRAVNFLAAAGSIGTRTLQLIDLGSIITNEPLSQLLRRVISLDRIRGSRRLLKIISTNWDLGEVRTFENSDVAGEFGYQVIQSSTSIPGVFPPQYVAGQAYVDGGLVMNTPLNCAIEAGGLTLHVIYMDPDVRNIPLRKLQNTIDTFDRVYVINFATKVNEDIDTAAWINEGIDAVERASGGAELSDADMKAFIRVAGQIERRMRAGKPYSKLTIHRYHPHDDLGGGTLGLLNFNRERVVALIERGFRDALNHDCATSHCILP
jgi:NTE family protein